MKRHLMIGLGVALALAMAGQSLVGQTGHRPRPPAGGPFDSLHFRQIGPASMSGRISDLAVYEANPAIFYVGTAHGGVWKTTNNGTTFEAQFQDQGLMSIGDVTISQTQPGSGLGRHRRVEQPAEHVVGRRRLQVDRRRQDLRQHGPAHLPHINRIVIDPRDNNVVLVAATGSLWGPGGERGVYKTTDGGKTWKQVLEGRRRHRRQRPGDGSVEQQDRSTRPPTSGAAPPAA